MVRTRRARSGGVHGGVVVAAAIAWTLAASGCVSEPQVEQTSQPAGTIAASSSSEATTLTTAPSPIGTPGTISAAERENRETPSTEPLTETADVTADATDTATEEVEPYVEPVSSDASARGVLLPDGTRSRRSKEQFRAVEAGGNHTCAIRLDETVQRWGNNGLNQLESPNGTFAQISAGTDHTCGVRNDSSLVCWGFNGYEVAESPAGSFASVSAGDTHSCASRTGGTVSCWGWDTLDRLDPPPGEFTSVAVGTWTSCGLRRDDMIECWGADWWGMQDVPEDSFSQIAVDGGHACGVRDDGTVICWGLQDCTESHKVWEGYDPLHIRTNTSTGYRLLRCWSPGPAVDLDPVDAPSGVFTSVAVTSGHSCGLRADGAATCWGTGRHGGGYRGEGRIGADDMGVHYDCVFRAIGEDCSRIGDYSHSDIPPGNYASISAGRGHSCGLHVDGTVECWGDNFYGEIDIPEEARDGHPSQARIPESGFVAVSVGNSHS